MRHYKQQEHRLLYGVGERVRRNKSRKEISEIRDSTVHDKVYCTVVREKRHVETVESMAWSFDLFPKRNKKKRWQNRKKERRRKRRRMAFPSPVPPHASDPVSVRSIGEDGISGMRLQINNIFSLNETWASFFFSLHLPGMLLFYRYYRGEGGGVCRQATSM